MTKTATVHAQQRWEYMTISRKTNTYLAQELNTLGQDGWELVTTNYARGKKEEMFWTAILKRPTVGNPAPGTAHQEAARHDLAAPAPEEAKRDPAESLQGFDLDGDTFTISDDPDKQEQDQ